MANFSVTHIPALFIGSAFIVGGGLPFYSAKRAMLEFGLSPRRAEQEAAQAIFPIYGSRVQIHGLAIWIFYLQGKLEVVDTMLAVLIYAGIVDWYICAQDGMPGFWRFLGGAFFGAWGAFGLTARGLGGW